MKILTILFLMITILLLVRVKFTQPINTNCDTLDYSDFLKAVKSGAITINSTPNL